MEENKNVLANLYGARVSKNGKWLNLIFVARINGEERRFTCPVRMNDDCKHAFAFTELDASGNTRASICHIPVYADNKKDEPKKPVIPDFPF